MADDADAAMLDQAIDRALSGRAAPDDDPTVLWLTAALRADPPPSLTARLRREQRVRVDRRWRPVQVAAAAVSALLLTHGLGNLFNSEWVARGLGENHSPHAFREGGLALIAAGIAVAAGVFDRRWLPVSVVVGTPLGLALGVGGVEEVGEFAAGAVLHLTQGACAIALVVLFFRARRYDRGPANEGGS